MSLRRTILLAVSLVGATAVLAPGSALAGHVDCGDVLTESTTLDRDLTCGGADVAALVVGAPGIEIDLGGHTLTGNFGDDNVGVRNDGHHGVTIRNGVIRTFERGVYLVDADNNRVRKLALVENSAGVLLLESDGNRVERNRFVENFGGITLWTSDGNLLRRNDVVRSRLTGVSLVDASSNVIESNRIVDGGADDPDFSHGLSVSGDDNTIRRNRLKRNAQDGLWVSGASTGTLVERNQAIGNGDDGIDVRNSATTLTRNSAHRNSDLGIFAVPGVTDGGGNRARGNGNPAQCVNVRCT